MVQDLAAISALFLFLDRNGCLIHSLPKYQMTISLSDNRLPIFIAFAKIQVYRTLIPSVSLVLL